jgi:hypothetical protein
MCGFRGAGNCLSFFLYHGELQKELTMANVKDSIFLYFCSAAYKNFDKNPDAPPQTTSQNEIPTLDAGIQTFWNTFT